MNYTPNTDKKKVHSHSRNPALVVSAVAFSVKWYFISKNQWEDIRCFLIVSMARAIPSAYIKDQEVRKKDLKCRLGDFNAQRWGRDENKLKILIPKSCLIIIADKYCSLADSTEGITGLLQSYWDFQWIALSPRCSVDTNGLLMFQLE